ncbi:RNA 2',3'-cyclic phosphodiesterase [subsurface metagenome]
MRHRIFIAINLPENVKKELVNYQSKWPELPVRWTGKDNLHITLEFLGYLTDEELLKACQDTKTLASKHEPFLITLNKICYGPPKKPPRMIWVVGEKVEELNFSPHITLGRMNAWEFRKIEPEERPQVDEDINLSFEVNSIEVMESVLKRTGPTYNVIESCQLKS